jgi:hypothetical protein
VHIHDTVAWDAGKSNIQIMSTNRPPTLPPPPPLPKPLPTIIPSRPGVLQLRLAMCSVLWRRRIYTGLPVHAEGPEPAVHASRVGSDGSVIQPHRTRSSVVVVRSCLLFGDEGIVQLVLLICTLVVMAHHTITATGIGGSVLSRARFLAALDPGMIGP